MNWLLWDTGKIGTYFQCKAVASCFKEKKFEEIPITLSLWQQLSPWKIGFPYASPDLIIAGGRQAIHVAKWFKHRCPTVIVQNPRCSLKGFTLVIAPKHDDLKEEPNLITTLGSLCVERDFNKNVPWNLSSPWCGVVLGGNSRHYTYTREDAKKLACHLLKFPHSFVITPSRRTPKEWIDYLCEFLKEGSFWIWNGEGENPYAAILKKSDILVVTNDSISMISETCSTGKPVYIVDLPLKTERILSLSKMLVEEGYAKFLGTVYDFKPQKILNEIERIQPLIISRINEWIHPNLEKVDF